MKKKVLTVCTVCVVILAAFTLLPDRPDGTADTPELAEITDFTQEQLDERLTGLMRAEIYHSWGEPDGHLSGLWGDTWQLDSEKDRYVIVYYDKDGIIENVRVDDLSA